MSLLFHEEKSTEPKQLPSDRTKTFEIEEKFNCHMGLPDSDYDRLDQFEEEIKIYAA
jgi:hypothetical protein